METNIPDNATNSTPEEQKKWSTPELEQLDIAEDTNSSIVNSGGDGGFQS